MSAKQRSLMVACLAGMGAALATTQFVRYGAILWTAPVALFVWFMLDMNSLTPAQVTTRRKGRDACATVLRLRATSMRVGSAGPWELPPVKRYELEVALPGHDSYHAVVYDSALARPGDRVKVRVSRRRRTLVLFDKDARGRVRKVEGGDAIQNRVAR